MWLVTGEVALLYNGSIEDVSERQTVRMEGDMESRSNGHDRSVGHNYGNWFLTTLTMVTVVLNYGVNDYP